MMNSEIDRNLGKQPIASILEEYKIKRKDLVECSTEQITYKMVSRACKGRRLTDNVKHKMLNALMIATNSRFALEDLFTY